MQETFARAQPLVQARDDRVYCIQNIAHRLGLTVARARGKASCIQIPISHRTVSSYFNSSFQQLDVYLGL